MNKRSLRTAAIIPARYASTRFPGKPLAAIAGKPMIQWVYERAQAAKTIDEVVIATDDTRILEAVTAFGGQAVMTAASHQTGTDRIAEAAAEIDADLIVNLQGDEPLLPSLVIDRLVEAMQTTGAEMGTVAVPFACTEADPADPNAVKVVVDSQGRALYFSRAPIPHCRTGGTPVEPLLHWGLYAYRRAFLEQYVSWPQGALEKCEMLEQLRAVENGVRILVIETTERSIGVDLPEDAAKVERMMEL
jgi:3-deoxy-manno-octulosonate cytidylyltransferase (CMP-KDO synthetase)